MSPQRVLYEVARADFLERVRRYSFLLTMLFALYLGYAAATGKIMMRLRGDGGDYRGVYTSAWIGTLVALVTTCFVSLVGFYIVKNSIERDRLTRVGEILASTPLKKDSYTVGKFLSNFAILALMVAALAVAAVAMQLFHGEDPRFDLWGLLSPFLMVALPAMALTAALAVLFETLPVLRGGAGNVLWFFLWVISMTLAMITRVSWLDPFGFFTVMQNIAGAARAGIPGYTGGFSLRITDDPITVADGFRWAGIHWTENMVLIRLMWIGVAIALALLAAAFFDRFDSSRAVLPGSRKPDEKLAGREALKALLRPAAPVHLSPLKTTAAFGLARILLAELRLALKGFRWWWYAVAAALVVAQIASPLEVARGPLLTAAWIWPVLVWSAMGVRESRCATGQLIFSSARILPRQLPACWLAGVAVSLLMGAGAAARLLLAGQSSGVLAWATGALFVPSLAFSLGIWSGTSKVFEAVYTALWYAGPLNRIPGLDFTGAAGGAQTLHYALLYLALAAALMAAAFLGRIRQLRPA
jgi:hypothetical protein